MFWMRAYPLRGEVGGGLGPGILEFLGPVKWHPAGRLVRFGTQKTYAQDAHTEGFRAHTVEGGGAGE